MLKELIKWCIPHGIYNIYTKRNNMKNQIISSLTHTTTIQQTDEILVNYSDYRILRNLKENFIEINAVDTFKFNEDSVNNLSIFDNGIDVIVMRGTGILSLKRENDTDCLYSVKTNIIELLKVINKNGIIFCKK